MSAQGLAIAVLQRAVKDLQDPASPARRRLAARAFLLDADRIDFWAAVAGLDPDLVHERARKL